MLEPVVLAWPVAKLGPPVTDAFVVESPNAEDAPFRTYRKHFSSMAST
jgi:hypothetical protein